MKQISKRSDKVIPLMTQPNHEGILKYKKVFRAIANALEHFFVARNTFLVFQTLFVALKKINCQQFGWVFSALITPKYVYSLSSLCVGILMKAHKDRHRLPRQTPALCQFHRYHPPCCSLVHS